MTRICPNEDCSFHGRPQPISQFRARHGRPAGICRTCSLARDVVRRARRRATGQPVDLEPGGRLPLAPFRAWLHDRHAELALTEDWPAVALEVRLGVSNRTILRWLNDPCAQFVLLDAVDAALCRWGDPGQLRILYPSVYDLPVYVEPPEPGDMSSPRARLVWLGALHEAGLGRVEMGARFAEATGVQLTPRQISNLLRRPVSRPLWTSTQRRLMGVEQSVAA